MDNKLIVSLNEWHVNAEYDKIIKTILAIPNSELNYEIVGQLGRAYNNIDAYDKAIECLMSVSEKGASDCLWNFRLGYSYFYKEDYEKALLLFEKSYELGDSQSLEYIEDCRKMLGSGKQQLKDDTSLNTTTSNIPHSPPN